MQALPTQDLHVNVVWYTNKAVFRWTVLPITASLQAGGEVLVSDVILYQIKVFLLFQYDTYFSSVWIMNIIVYQKHAYWNMKFTWKKQKKIHIHTVFTKTPFFFTSTSLEAKPSNTSVSESVSSVKIFCSSSVRYLGWYWTPCKNTSP